LYIDYLHWSKWYQLYTSNCPCPQRYSSVVTW
jgi:hypothetical protein